MMVTQKKFVTVFPAYEDFHFYKDPGQIPFRFSKLGFTSAILCLSDGRPMPVSEKYLELIRIPSSFFYRKFNAGIVLYLLKNAGKISILNLLHMSWPSLLFATVYKIVNRHGFTYLKLDASRYSGHYPWEDVFGQRTESRNSVTRPAVLKERIKGLIAKRYFIKNIDLWSAEDSYTCQSYESEYPFMGGKMIRVYNGHSADLTEHGIVNEYSKKENIILTVGRLGTHQKATDILLEGFSIIAGKCNYDLHLAGTVDPSFNATVRKFQDGHPELKKRIFFHGELGKSDLYKLYNRSRIFCLPSRYEGMAIVYQEAMYFRNVTVTTPYVSPAGLIREFSLGLITEGLDPEVLAKTLLAVISDYAMAEILAENAYRFSHENFNWDGIVKELYSEIELRQQRKIEELQGDSR
jgi:glycosyltransferase involved in cell wall biosynthesis